MAESELARYTARVRGSKSAMRKRINELEAEKSKGTGEWRRAWINSELRELRATLAEGQ